MRSVLVTGSAGFIGKNLRQALCRRSEIKLICFDVHDNADILESLLAEADVIFHLAGVNRPDRIEDFEEVNAGLTRMLVTQLATLKRQPTVIMSSSTQAGQENPYGISKREAEEALAAFARRTGAPVRVYRLPGVFGKWCRPNYNSVVATFCYNIARDLPIEISDPSREIVLMHVQDVVRRFCADLDSFDLPPGLSWGEASPLFRITLGRLAELIRSFQESRVTLITPDMADPFLRRLHSTYMSYLPEHTLAYDLAKRQDSRGILAEMFKSPHFGQIFVSRTKPGITRGNHYHDVKFEKFCVVEGEAMVRLRSVEDHKVYEYPISGRELRVVEIPPGYAHSIENVGVDELITLFWANEVFDVQDPDTFPEIV